MKKENQYCLVDQSKRLRELGVIQESEYYHSNFFDIRKPEEYKLCRRFKTTIILDEFDYFDGGHFGKAVLNKTTFSAFSVAELNTMLPVYYYAMRHIDNPTLVEQWICECGENSLACINETQASCLAEMLIYLLEEKIITADEVNERLLAA